MKPSRKRPRKRETAADDLELWQHVARSVAPLRRRRLRGDIGGELPPEPQTVKTEAPRAPARPVAHVRMQPARPPATAPELAAGAAPGLDRRTATRLRRGNLQIEARIDLHGHSRADAHTALLRFLPGAQERGVRCALVITGKGRFGEAGGVIRRELPGWLNDPRLRPIIVAFAEAQPRDGGGGAFYVYLRRTRDR